MHLEKRCPNGYHKDPRDGQCKDPVTGEVYQNVQHKEELSGKPSKPKESPSKKPKDSGTKETDKPVTENGVTYYPKNSKISHMTSNAWAVDDGNHPDCPICEKAKENRKGLMKYVEENGNPPKVRVNSIAVRINENGVPEETTDYDAEGVKFLDGHNDTQTLYTNKVTLPDGRETVEYSPERQKFHQQVIDEFFRDRKFKKAEGREPIVLMTGGGSGTGKSSMNSKLQEALEGQDPKAITIDPDWIMTEKIPEYKMCMKQNPLTSAYLCHNEASHIANLIMQRCLQEGYDFVWDGTMSKESKVKSNINQFKDAGYTVKCRGIFMPPDSAWDSCRFRFVNQGRYVPEDIARSSNQKFTENMHNQEILDMFDDVEVYYRERFDDKGHTAYSKTKGKEATKDDKYYNPSFMTKKMRKSKSFKEYTESERKQIWDSVQDALDEAGHDIYQLDIMDNLPEDEKKFMELEQFYGIVFDKDNFKDVITVHILNGNDKSPTDRIDFDAVLSQHTKHHDTEKILQETPMDMVKMKKSGKAQLFRDLIERYIKEHDDEEDPLLTDYTFEEFDDRMEFRFDGTLYELINYGMDMSEFGGSGEDYTFREGLEELLDKEVGYGYEPVNYYTWAYYKINDDDMEKSCEHKAIKSKLTKSFDMEIGEDGRYKIGGDTHLKVYQRDFERMKAGDEEYARRMMNLGLGWEFAEEHGGAPTMSDYKMMWEGDLNIHGDPEGAFSVLQDRRPIETSRTMYSLSVGDIVEMNGRLYFCDDMGFMDVTDIIKSKTKKDEKKIPITDDDTVEIEEMDGEKYVEIEPKDEHAEEVETGYEKESDDLNTEDNVTHPDTSKKSRMTPNQAVKACLEYQIEKKRNGLMEDEIEQITGNRPEYFMQTFLQTGRVRKMKCADGWMYNFRM